MDTIANHVIYSETSGKAVEKAFFIGGKWQLYFTASPSSAKQLTREEADRIIAEAEDQENRLVSMPFTEFEVGF